MQRHAARQQLKLLGGGYGSVIKRNSIVEKALILVQRNIEVVTEGGLRTEVADVATLLVEEVGTLTRGDRLEVGGNYLDIGGPLSDDGFVVKVLLRG